MQPEKNFYVDEIGSYLDRSDYTFLVDFTGMTVAQFETLRKELAKLDAEMHVVKNRLLKLAASQRNLPEINDWLKGHTGLIFGGSSIPDVVKVIEKFQKTQQDRPVVKGAILDGKLVDAADFSKLKDLPTIETARAQLLSLINVAAQDLVNVLNAPQRDFLSVLLQRKMKLEEGSEA